MSYLALSLIPMTGCGSVVRTLVPQVEQTDRPEPPAVLTSGCPAPPPMPPRSAFPANDVRPLVAVMTEQIGAGDQCRTVVDGWKAWDTCMRLRLKNAAAACPVLEGILEQLAPPPADAPPKPLVGRPTS